MSTKKTSEQNTLLARLPKDQPILVRAMNLGERLHLRGLYEAPLVTSPLVVAAGERGLGMLFRYGVAVTFGVTDAEQKTWIKTLKERIEKPYRRPETEDTRILIGDPTEGVKADGITVASPSIPRFQVIATVLARSVALAHDEAAIAAAFDAVEPLARKLDQPRTSGRALRAVLRHIGQTLLAQQKMIGRVEIADKPDILWEQPDLERLYTRLEDEYELTERSAVLGRKLALVARTAETTLDLVQTRRMLRVEWYIVALIVFEVALTLFEMWRRAIP